MHNVCSQIWFPIPIIRIGAHFKTSFTTKWVEEPDFVWHPPIQALHGQNHVPPPPPTTQPGISSHSASNDEIRWWMRRPILYRRRKVFLGVGVLMTLTTIQGNELLARTRWRCCYIIFRNIYIIYQFWNIYIDKMVIVVTMKWEWLRLFKASRCENRQGFPLQVYNCNELLWSELLSWWS